MPSSCVGSQRVGCSFRSHGYRQANTGDWRWIPRLGVILSGLATILVALTYWPPKVTLLQQRDGRTKWQEAAALDWVGLVLFAGGLASFLMGTTWAALYPASDPHVVACLVVGLASIASFVGWSYFIKKDDAIIPHRLFKGKAVVRFAADVRVERVELEHSACRPCSSSSLSPPPPFSLRSSYGRRQPQSCMPTVRARRPRLSST
jgi:hypothetical protein